MHLPEEGVIGSYSRVLEVLFPFIAIVAGFLSMETPPIEVRIKVLTLLFLIVQRMFRVVISDRPDQLKEIKEEKDL